MNPLPTLTRATLAEFTVINRRGLWIGLGATAIGLAAVITWLLVGTEVTMGRGATAVRVDAQAIAGPDGATAATLLAFGFAALLVVAAFAAAMGNDITRGTLRAAFARQQSRSQVITGKLLARIGVALAILAIAVAAGAVTTAIVASARGDDLGAWVTSDGLASFATSFVRLAMFVTMYALIGTAVATVCRSTPIALGVLLLWFGPIENIVGDGRPWALDWFPGLLLRGVLTPPAGQLMPAGSALLTLGAYAVIAVGVIAVAVTRRDVTA